MIKRMLTGLLVTYASWQGLIFLSGDQSFDDASFEPTSRVRPGSLAEVPVPAEPEVLGNQPLAVASLVLAPKVTFFQAMQDQGFSAPQILHLVKTAKPHRDLGRISQGTTVKLVWNQAVSSLPDAIQIHDKTEKYLELRRDFSDWEAETKEIEAEIVYESFAGIVSSSLWNSARQAGMNTVLIQDLSDIFGWQVDFGREVVVGDKWRLVVARRVVEGRTLDWGPIIAAEYENAGVVFTAIRFAKEGLKEEYFQPDGRSLKSMFLKSPLRFARITSRFSPERYHPVLKVNRPHLGVDYAAPTGTPVRAVGAGVIEDARFRKTSGKFIRIRHNATYQTAYKHLSRFANHIQRGTRVEQGEVIGYVGATGLVTGPHLHFEFYERGSVIDPLGRKFPSADPVPDELLPEYREHVAARLLELPDWPSASADERRASLPFESRAYAEGVKE